MKQFIVLMVWFVFGFSAQRCVMASSTIIKGMDANECTRVSVKVDVITECYDYKQSAMSRSFINLLNPASDLFDKWFTDMLFIISLIPPEGDGEGINKNHGETGPI